MKHGGFKVVCLILMASIAVLSAYADEVTVDLTSIILEAFNGDTAHEWNDGSHPRSYDFSWTTDASKFATKTTNSDGAEDVYPKLAYIETWPQALFGHNREGKTIKSLGLHGKFDRRGYNWIDIYPTKDDKPFEIPMPGRIRYFDLWVWGSNLDYYLEAYVRDYQGVVHKFKLGDISYTGWKNLRVNIPNNVRQAKRILPNLAQLKFVKFRLWTQPSERVGDFYVYLKQFKVLTDTFESLFDGDELADPDLLPQLWTGGDTATN